MVVTQQFVVSKKVISIDIDTNLLHIFLTWLFERILYKKAISFERICKNKLVNVMQNFVTEHPLAALSKKRSHETFIKDKLRIIKDFFY